MHHELEARGRLAMEETINDLQQKLRDIQADFAECARTRKSPCFFCIKNEACDYQSCNFVWKKHN